MANTLYKVADNVDNMSASDLDQLVDALTGANDIGQLQLFAPISAPSAPSAAVNTTSGNLNGAYKYAVAFITGYWKGTIGVGTLNVQGNTGGGAQSNTSSPSNQQINLSNIPVGPVGTVARAIYRTKAGGSTFYFLTQINDNTTLTYTDNATDASITQVMPTTNTTGTSFGSPIVSSVAQGTAPMQVASNTLNTNFNADFLDGLHADGVVGQRIQNASPAQDQYWLVGTLPYSQSTTYDKLIVEFQGGPGYDSTSLINDWVVMGNRDTGSGATSKFAYQYMQQGLDTGNTRQNLRMIAYKQADGSVQVYLRGVASTNAIGIIAAYGISVNSQINTALPIGASTTTVPSGTIVFDSGNSVTYPANAGITLGSVTLGADPTTALGAVTKQLLDSFVNTNPAPTAMNLVNGLQVVTAIKGATFENVNIVGRTLVNLLGRDGNCESLNNRWQLFNVTSALDTSIYDSGTSSHKLTVSNGSNVEHYEYQPISIKSNSKYIIVGKARPNSGRASIRVVTTGALQTPYSNVATDTTKLTMLRLKIATTTETDANIRLHVQNSAGVYSYIGAGENANFDGIRAYEVTLAEYNAFDALTDAQVEAKYAYVDDVKHVNAPYVIKYGENLLPTFNEWINYNATTLTIKEPYNISHTANATFEAFYVDIPVISGQSYTASWVGNLQASFQAMDSTKTNIGSNTGYAVSPATFTTPTNAAFIRFYLGNGAQVAGTYTATNPMLNLGTTAKTFKPRNDDSLFFPNAQFASSVDGTVYDSLVKKDGKFWRENRFVRDMVLDGSLAWFFDADATGFKRVAISSITNNLRSSNNFATTKYDGKILAPWNATNTADMAWFSTGVDQFTVDIADTDSGWGETYTPTAGEIQAYFYGWRMYDGSGSYSPYNGSGTKTWLAISEWGSGATTATTTLPTTYAPKKSKDWTPYKLTYQLATSTLEEIQVDAGMSLHEGLNQIEVGQGVVVREKANPIINGSGDSYVFNTSEGVGSLLKNRVSRFLSVYKYGKVDNTWILTNTFQPYGTYRAATWRYNYDPTATYEVSYIALDQYLLSAPIQTVNGETAANLKTVVDTLSTNQADQDARISANEILARQIYNVPQKTTAAMTLYVDATNGADNNDGSAGKPFKTTTAAVNKILQTPIVNHTITVNLADGTYNEGLAISGISGSGSILFQGNVTTPANVLISNVYVSVISLGSGIVIKGMKATTTTTYAFQSRNNTLVSFTNCVADAVSSWDAFLTFFDDHFSLTSCTASNHGYGIRGRATPNITADSCSGTGNTVGVLAEFGARLALINPSFPTGTTPVQVANGGEVISIASSGVLNPWGDNTQTARSHVAAWQNGAQSITGSVATKISMNSTSKDQLSEFDTATNYRFTAKSAGIYQVNAGVAFNISGAASTIFLGLYKNGGEIQRMGQLATGSSQSLQIVNGSIAVFLNAGDYLELYGYTGATYSTVSGNSYLNITRIA